MDCEHEREENPLRVHGRILWWLFLQAFESFKMEEVSGTRNS